MAGDPDKGCIPSVASLPMFTIKYPNNGGWWSIMSSEMSQVAPENWSAPETCRSCRGRQRDGFTIKTILTKPSIVSCFAPSSSPRHVAPFLPVSSVSSPSFLFDEACFQRPRENGIAVWACDVLRVSRLYPVFISVGFAVEKRVCVLVSFDVHVSRLTILPKHRVRLRLSALQRPVPPHIPPSLQRGHVHPARLEHRQD